MGHLCFYRDDPYHWIHSILFHSRALTLHSTFLYNSESVIVINYYYIIICLTNSKATFPISLIMTAVSIFSLWYLISPFNLIYSFVGCSFFSVFLYVTYAFTIVCASMCHFMETACTCVSLISQLMINYYSDQSMYQSNCMPHYMGYRLLYYSIY